ncbi:MAG: NADH-quinone oxidoreductase subunit N [Phycisphaerales bacterium]
MTSTITPILAAATIADKLPGLWPEIVLFIASCVVMVIGLSRRARLRDLCAPICLLALAVAFFIAYFSTPDSSLPLVSLPRFGKIITCIVGAMILLLLSGTADRDYEAAVARGSERYDPLRANRAEFYAFFLFSLTGLMLTAGADDLIWLFLALELTSLPTYIMVTISTRHNRSMEAGVKYFFLGALGAAIFLYGFALIYGGTGSTDLGDIQAALAAQQAAGGINGIALAGLLLSLVGLGFKIAAVPMHFYTPDVYQGASATVAAMLAFVPKTAGFLALLLLLSTVGWFSQVSGSDVGMLPSPIHELLWVMAALTMTVGNVLAVIQSSVKRVLAYSSIAHSGYMLVGLLSGPGRPGADFTENGLAAVLFYLLAYGVMNLGAFAVLASLERSGPDGRPDEIDSFDDLRGLCRTRPAIGYTMVLSALGLLGLPPTLGFFAKLPLLTTATAAGHTFLVVILVINSAIAAFYYLRLAGTPWLETTDSSPGVQPARVTPYGSRIVAGILSAAGVVVLSLFPGVGAKLTHWAERSAEFRRVIAPAAQADPSAIRAEAFQPAASPLDASPPR